MKDLAIATVVQGGGPGGSARSSLGPYRANTPVHLAHFLCYPAFVRSWPGTKACDHPEPAMERRRSAC